MSLHWRRLFITGAVSTEEVLTVRVITDWLYLAPPAPLDHRQLILVEQSVPLSTHIAEPLEPSIHGSHDHTSSTTLHKSHTVPA
jgi:hypothetical protein